MRPLLGDGDRCLGHIPKLLKEFDVEISHFGTRLEIIYGVKVPRGAQFHSTRYEIPGVDVIMEEEERKMPS